MPDITGFRDGNCGIDYVHTWDSGMPGPHVLLSALVHGNEICGAIALDRQAETLDTLQILGGAR